MKEGTYRNTIGTGKEHAPFFSTMGGGEHPITDQTSFLKPGFSFECRCLLDKTQCSGLSYATSIYVRWPY